MELSGWELFKNDRIGITNVATPLETEHTGSVSPKNGDTTFSSFYIFFRFGALWRSDAQFWHHEGTATSPQPFTPAPQFKSQSKTEEGFQRERGGSRLVPDHQNSIDFQSILKESGTWPGKVNRWSRPPLLYENLGLDLFDLQGG